MPIPRVRIFKRMWKTRDNIERSYKTIERVNFFIVGDSSLSKGRITVYVCLFGQKKISEYETAVEPSQERHMRKKGSWNNDFSSSQVGEDILSGVHVSQTLRVKGQKTSRKQTQCTHGIEYCALNTPTEWNYKLFSTVLDCSEKNCELWEKNTSETAERMKAMHAVKAVSNEPQEETDSQNKPILCFSFTFLPFLSSLSSETFVLCNCPSLLC